MKVLLVLLVTALPLCVECLDPIFTAPVFETNYLVKGGNVTFHCLDQGLSTVIQWFRLYKDENGKPRKETIAQRFSGAISFYNDFNIPKGRTYFDKASIVVQDVRVEDEGDFYCTTITSSNPESTGLKQRLIVWNIPEEPRVERLDRESPLTENVTAEVARCISEGGKPASNLTWYNGTEKMTTGVNSYTQQSEEKYYLNNSYSDLKILAPTRFDNGRVFSCLVEHEGYYGKSKWVNVSVTVNYAPVNVYIWVNLTTKYVFCESDANPTATIDIYAPGKVKYPNNQNLYYPNLYSAPGYQYFECVATNIVGSSERVKVLVDDLLYPDGKPGFAGLEYWMWGVIGGGALIVLVVIIVCSCCCCCRREKKKKNKANKNNGGPSQKSPFSVEIMPTSTAEHHYSQPSLIEMENRRGGGSDSPRPSETSSYPAKPAMNRTYSLERLVDEKYGPPTSGVTASSSSNSAGRHQPYTHNPLDRRPSKEELDDVADHIELLSKSWDNLARSREQLNRSRDDLHVELPPSYQPVDPQPPSQHPFGDRGFVSLQRLNDRPSTDEDDNEDQHRYPYMDDQATDGHSSQEASDYRDHSYRGSYRGGNHDYDQQQHRYYQQPPSHHDPRRYEDQRYYDGNHDDQARRDSNDSFDSEFDDRSSADYDHHGNHQQRHRGHHDDNGDDGDRDRYDRDHGFLQVNLV